MDTRDKKTIRRVSVGMAERLSLMAEELRLWESIYQRCGMLEEMALARDLMLQAGEKLMAMKKALGASSEN